MLALMFILIHLVAPTPVQMARLYAPNPRLPDAQLLNIAKRLGFTQPLWAQFATYLGQVFTGNLGTDVIYKVPELQVIEQYLPITLELVIIGQILGALIGIFTGAISAANRNTGTDYVVKGFYLVTWSAPVFLVAVALQLGLAYTLNLLPSSGIADPFLSAPAAVTGFPIIDAIIAGNWTYLMSVLQHLVLPALTIAIIGFGVITRLTRASMVDALDKEYVKLAYMKGLSKTKVVFGTAFRNALIPIVTLIALLFGFAVGGAVVVEDIFLYKGLGYFTVQAVLNLDYTALLAITVIFGVSIIIANFIADILYGVVDPRVRVS
jgi:peptide/nickel transport system permease protein